MTIKQKINQIKEIKEAIKLAIRNKGQTISDTDTFSSYASKIDNIQNASGNIEDYFETTLSTTSPAYIASRCLKKFPFNLIDTSNITSMSNLFSNCTNLTDIDLSNINTSKTNNMAYMFYYCSSLTNIDLSNFNTSKVTTMANMFTSCYKLSEIDVSGFDTSNLQTTSSMFTSCRSLVNLDLSNFDTSNVTNISSMFSYCSNLEIIHGILDLQKATIVSNMFIGCSALQEVRIKNLSITGLSLNSSSNLSHESLIYLINNLVSTTTTKTIILGSINLAKLTDEEKTIATEKGWTLA